MIPNAEPTPGSAGLGSRVTRLWMVGDMPFSVASASFVAKKSNVTRVPATPPTLEPAGSVTPVRVKDAYGAEVGRAPPPKLMVSTAGALKVMLFLTWKVGPVVASVAASVSLGPATYWATRSLVE
jgi:hypothetical protein